MPKKLSKEVSSSLKDSIKKSKVTINRESLWKGPSAEGPHGGITFSSLSRWLVNREHFRLRMVEGLVRDDQFSHHAEYGNLLHIGFECAAAHKDWEKPLKDYAIELAKRYKEQSSQISHWFNVARTQLPIYFKYWEKQKDNKNRKSISAEEVFDVPYTLPSGRVVRLRGKFDSVDLIDRSIWLMENKSRGEIDEAKVVRDLTSDLQTMLYLSVLQIKYPDEKVGGVRYNIVRRPLSGGKHSISQRKGRMTKTGLVGQESSEEFYERLGTVISENPKDFFVRFKMEVSKADLLNFQQKCLDPILESLVLWWDSIEADPFNPWLDMGFGCNPHHFIFPSGVYSPQLEGRGTDYDELLSTGNRTGLVTTDKLFSELQ